MGIHIKEIAYEISSNNLSWRETVTLPAPLPPADSSYEGDCRWVEAPDHDHKIPIIFHDERWRLFTLSDDQYRDTMVSSEELKKIKDAKNVVCVWLHDRNYMKK
jgi:hypothetical protein